MLFIIIVLYNERINYKYNFKKKISINSHIIFIDNSTEYEVIEFNKNCKSDEWTYISCHGNIGLSKAYNFAINYLKSNFHLDEKVWIMTLDDDTDLSDEYLYNLSKILPNTKFNVVSGIIQDQNGDIMSPLKYVNNKQDGFISEQGIYSNIMCINSGLVIRSTVFNQIRYDEDLFLDMIDYKLFYDLKKNNIDTVLILSGNIVQSFSGKDVCNRINSLRRYNIYKKDYITFCHKTNIGLLRERYRLLKRRISIDIKYIIYKIKH